MHEEVSAHIDEYLKAAEARFAADRSTATDNTRLRAAVERLEKTEEFASLGRATAGAFKRCDWGFENGTSATYAATFFRMSGVYSDLARGLAPTHVQQRYFEAFESTSYTITHLAPIEFVEFSDDVMKFGQCEIRRFSRKELDRLLQKTVREAFYGWAVIDSSVLEDYWLLSVQDSAEAKDLDRNIWDEVFDSRVQISYSEHPPAVQFAMRQVALFDWQDAPKSAPDDPRPTKRSEWDGPFLPRIPFVISVSDSLIHPPRPGPNLATLRMEPDFDPYTGEVLGERRMQGILLDEGEAEQFACFLRGTSDLLESIQPYRKAWRFIDTAMDFLLKACVTQGVEQLLWHMTAIDAVVGQNKPSRTERLRRRVSNILGGSENERKDFSERFEELYKYRCALVHGNADLADRKIYLGHLAEARDFARCVVVWMLHYLGHLARSILPGTAGVPSRDDLLNLIDLESDRHRYSAAMLNSLPPTFPHVKDWF